MSGNAGVGISGDEIHEARACLNSLIVHVERVVPPRCRFPVQALRVGDLCPGEPGILFFYEVTFFLRFVLDVQLYE